jgi:type VI secretion system protein ImpH
MTPLGWLREAPHRFRFDAAVRLLVLGSRHVADGDKVLFKGLPVLSQPVAEVVDVELPTAGQRAVLRTPLIGLVGPSGVMPRWYTELVAQANRARSRGIADFFDLLAQRFVMAFAQAGAKYRLARSAEVADPAVVEAEPIGAGVLAFTGFGTAHMVERLAAGPEVLRYYSGYFSARPRSADRLAAMVSDFLGRRTELREFVGAWLTLSADQQTRLPRGRAAGAYNRLSVDAVIGTRAWDQQARFVVRVGPLNRAEFEALLPDRRKLGELVSLIRAYVGWEADFAVQLVLAAPEIPVLRLAGPGIADAPRLGWTSWAPSTTDRLKGRVVVDDAVFAATLVEAQVPRETGLAA